MDDIEAIKQLKARYFRCLDTKDWDGFRDVFAPDVTVDTSSDDGHVHHGRDAFVAFLRPILADAVTVHQGHMPEITSTSDTTATGIWAMEDYIEFGPDAPVKTVHGRGHYHETYVKLDGEWKIGATKLTRLHVDVET